MSARPAVLKALVHRLALSLLSDKQKMTIASEAPKLLSADTSEKDYIEAAEKVARALTTSHFNESTEEYDQRNTALCMCPRCAHVFLGKTE